MQITLDIPDALPHLIIQQALNAFNDKINQWQNSDAIDPIMCQQTLMKIQQGDLSQFTEIEDIDAHIAMLKNEINQK